MSILKLPITLNVGDEDYEINSDFRPCFGIMQVFERNDLTDTEKLLAMIGILFVDDIENIPPQHLEEAITKAQWFLDCGDEPTKNKSIINIGKLYSWEQDAKYIISAVDLTKGISCRSLEYMHWWDFVSTLMECKECTFSTLIHQRKLKKQGKQSKYDKEWWIENKNIAELKTTVTLTPEEQEKLDKFNKLLG